MGTTIKIEYAERYFVDDDVAVKLSDYLTFFGIDYLMTRDKEK